MSRDSLRRRAMASRMADGYLAAQVMGGGQDDVEQDQRRRLAAQMVQSLQGLYQSRMAQQAEAQAGSRQMDIARMQMAAAESARSDEGRYRNDSLGLQRDQLTADKEAKAAAMADAKAAREQAATFEGRRIGVDEKRAEAEAVSRGLVDAEKKQESQARRMLSGSQIKDELTKLMVPASAEQDVPELWASRADEALQWADAGKAMQYDATPHIREMIEALVERAAKPMSKWSSWDNDQAMKQQLRYLEIANKLKQKIGDRPLTMQSLESGLTKYYPKLTS